MLINVKLLNHRIWGSIGGRRRKSSFVRSMRVLKVHRIGIRFQVFDNAVSEVRFFPNHASIPADLKMTISALEVSMA